MANLQAQTFPKSGEGTALLGKVREALRNLNSVVGMQGALPPIPPRKRCLSKEEDYLVPNYKQTWAGCNVTFDPQQAGAESTAEKTLVLGPFLYDLASIDVEKVILHEYLHRVLIVKISHHSFIDQTIEGIGYPPPFNPATGF